MIKNNKELVARYIHEIVNTGDVETIEDFIASGYTEVFNNQRFQVGIEGAKKHILGVRKTYPDLQLSIDRQFADGDWVITSYTMTGTHSGRWMDIRPTGKRIEVTGVNIDKIADGKIVEHGGAANLFESFLEAGAIQVIK